MSYSHLFVLDSITRAREDKRQEFDYYRDSLTYILAGDDTLTREYALLRAIAMMNNFQFDDYTSTVVHNKSVEEALPKTSDEIEDFLKHLAVMTLVHSDVCRTEDVIIFDAIACKYGYSLKMLDDVVEHITSRIGTTQQHQIDLRESILSSYKSAKQVDKEVFTRAYLAELEDYIARSNSPF